MQVTALSSVEKWGAFLQMTNLSALLNKFVQMRRGIPCVSVCVCLEEGEKDTGSLMHSHPPPAPQAIPISCGGIRLAQAGRTGRFSDGTRNQYVVPRLLAVPFLIGLLTTLEGAQLQATHFAF